MKLKVQNSKLKKLESGIGWNRCLTGEQAGRLRYGPQDAGATGDDALNLAVEAQ